MKQTSEDFSAFIQWKCSQSPGVRLLALLLIGVECVVYMVPLVTDSNQCLSPLAPLMKDKSLCMFYPCLALSLGELTMHDCQVNSL